MKIRSVEFPKIKIQKRFPSLVYDIDPVDDCFAIWYPSLEICVRTYIIHPDISIETFIPCPDGIWT